MTSDMGAAYVARYSGDRSAHIYPVEFVVRAFLGTYPGLVNDKESYRGKRVLDLGFGDGRNVPLLANLGMEVHGVEIAEAICEKARARLAGINLSIEARVGRNDSIPYPDQFFDHVLACHACYYVAPETHFHDNVREIARVLRPGGRFVFWAPIGTSYILRGAKDLGAGHMRVTNDPYEIRNGSILKKFDDPQEIATELGGHFQDFHIGSCRNDFWGIEEHVWCVVCHRRA